LNRRSRINQSEREEDNMDEEIIIETQTNEENLIDESKNEGLSFAEENKLDQEEIEARQRRKEERRERREKMKAKLETQHKVLVGLEVFALVSFLLAVFVHFVW